MRNSANQYYKMDFIKSGLNAVLGAPEPGQQPSAADTVTFSSFIEIITVFDLFIVSRGLLLLLYL